MKGSVTYFTFLTHNVPTGTASRGCIPLASPKLSDNKKRSPSGKRSTSTTTTTTVAAAATTQPFIRDFIFPVVSPSIPLFNQRQPPFFPFPGLPPSLASPGITPRPCPNTG
ncbi:hypothetical protein E2C01_070871 [Portunus trituberculatus]|uniref:Uncharacterized protein n=1 Tax=Portunus trituberculatus TaxID=210409 RepID=A0A5B7I6H7_PORTR|nr:hypothetical protein [Portunus trituberculatus]